MPFTFNDVHWCSELHTLSTSHLASRNSSCDFSFSATSSFMSCWFREGDVSVMQIANVTGYSSFALPLMIVLPSQVLFVCSACRQHANDFQSTWNPKHTRHENPEVLQGVFRSFELELPSAEWLYNSEKDLLVRTQRSRWGGDAKFIDCGYAAGGAQ